MGKLLEQLRDRRDALEAEIKAPVVKELYQERRQKDAAVKAYQEIEFKLGQDIINRAMEIAKDEIARSISEQFIKCMNEAGAYDENEDFIFKISRQYARMAHPDRLTQEALKEYVEWSRPRLKINARPMDLYTQVIQIKIPALALNVNVVMNK